MLAPSDVERIASLCVSISNDVADENGFVAVKHLLTKFNADLILRPLLVEGMIAESSAESGPQGRWKVLVDSETYDVTLQQVERESGAEPLATRFRNTVAHELVHLLALEPRRFGLRLELSTDDKVSRRALVKEIETQTERFSPLLLCSERALERNLKRRETALAIEDLVRMAMTLGVSKHVLVNRLRLMKPDDANRLRLSTGLRNVAVGLVQWTPQGTALIRQWPLFINFDRNIVPSFLTKLSKQDSVNSVAVFERRSFAMCGGLETKAEFVVDAGTPASPTVEKMKIMVSVEETSRGPGMESIFVVQKLI